MSKTILHDTKSDVWVGTCKPTGERTEIEILVGGVYICAPAERVEQMRKSFDAVARMSAVLNRSSVRKALRKAMRERTD